MPDDLDAALQRRFVHGDRDAFERLFRHFERDVYRWILRIVRDGSAAEDILVDAFWRAYRSRARFDPERSFGAWMRQIATRAALDHLHRTRQRRWTSLDEAEPLTTPPAAEAAHASDAVARVFRSLPPKLQIVASLALIEQQPHAEIADALEIPVGTVKSRLFRATRLLREGLERMGVRT
jgi:RNA polymerase sigma-70 factor (ECF subfamily)